MHRDDAAECRTWLKWELGQPVPDALWDELDQEGCVSPHLLGDPAEDAVREAREDLLAAARRRLGLRSPGRIRPGPPGFPLGVPPGGAPERRERGASVRGLELLSPKERARCEQIRADVACRTLELRPEWLDSLQPHHMAFGPPAIPQFQEEYLPGRLLTPEEAVSLLRSPAARYLSLRQFRLHSVPLTGHSARVLSREEGWAPAPAVDETAPPPWLCAYRHPLPERAFRRRVVLSFTPSGLEVESVFLADNENPVTQFPFWLGASHDGVVIADESRAAAEWERQFAERREVWPGSVMWHLAVLAGWLRRMGSSWSEGETARFVLAGERPPFWPFSVSERRPGAYAPSQGASLTMEVQPWLSDRTVARIYRSVRQRVQGAPVRSRRQAEDDGLRLKRFVESQPGYRRNPKRPGWRRIREAWNASGQHPKCASDSWMRRAYLDACRRVERHTLAA